VGLDEGKRGGGEDAEEDAEVGERLMVES